MDRAQPSDPLLRATRLLLTIAMGIAAVAGVALVAGIPLEWIFSDRIAARLTQEGVRYSSRGVLTAITSLLAMGAILMAMAFVFLRKLIAIIDTVGAGSPFTPENAARLRTMGWLALAYLVLSLLSTPAELWLRHALPGSHIEISFDFGALIAALLLFILARVFDHGARLEQDVEGTV
jgi:Protein of unknown function (DUF2975)